MTYMVTLALALVTFSDKSKHVFYNKKKTNKQQNKTEYEQTRPPVQV